jgi:isoleucyl-tRNA synthetase
VDYKDTVNLPKTDFPMKANLAEREPAQVKEWEEQKIFEAMLAKNAAAGGRRFVMHDGPPYANGHTHIGHALNKILKDIVVKWHGMKGEVADFIPGWDCHGLPIERKVEDELGSKRREMDRPAVIAACRAYANKWIAIQREEFKRLGIFARWDLPYATMQQPYEAETIRMFGRVAEKGYLVRGQKPVYWCITDRTALAEAEVEYEDHESPSIHVAFEVVSGLRAKELAGKKVRLVIWTTTPWTLPANLAVAAHPDFEYVAYDLAGSPVIVAKELLARFLAECAPGELAMKHVPVPTADGATGREVAALADPSRILCYLSGKDLEGVKYRHPFMGRESPVILGEHVTLEAGTGLVHTAPGHGHEDYVVGQRYGIAVLNPVDGAGKFTAEAGPYAGLGIWEANPKIVQDLKSSGHLLSDPAAKLKHSYPHCWRCHKPVVFRATRQWFLQMEHEGLRKRTLAEIDRLAASGGWIPPWGRDRIFGMIENRPDWCLSRQRTWGVPIPVFYCEKCEEPLVSKAVIDRVAAAFEKDGMEVWYTTEPAAFVGAEKCGKCGGAAFRREQDILDVWWDSGVSWSAVARARGLVPAGEPVDLYLEGSDQHRGWFHSSLLTAMATEGKAPYRNVLTHGFVLTVGGDKMSKSRGNAIGPDEVNKKYGAEVLRLWVTASDFRDDVRISQEILGGLAEGYRKIRNTLRYALSNLYDFDPAKDSVPAPEMDPLDRWAMARLVAWEERVKKAYDAYELHLVYHSTMDFCATELSSTYFDILKDRLYTAKKDSKARRSAQTALHAIAVDLARMMAPVMSFTAAEAWKYLPAPAEKSVFLAGLPARERPADADALEDRYGKIFAVRTAVQKALEVARKEKLIGSGLEAGVTVTAPADTLALLQSAGAELKFLFIVSKVTLAKGEAVAVTVEKAPGKKCERCWVYAEDLGENPAHPTVCAKCAAALS